MFLDSTEFLWFHSLPCLLKVEYYWIMHTFNFTYISHVFFWLEVQNHKILKWQKAVYITDRVYGFCGKKYTYTIHIVMTNLDSVLKSRDITLPTKVCIVNAMGFPVVMNRCASWIIKKAECQRLGWFQIMVLEKTWESLGLQGDQTSQS